MAAATTYSFDDAAPTRPSVEDLGGDDKLDDVGAPPGAGEPEAGAWNNLIRLAAGFARVSPTARISIGFTAGAPHIASLTAMRTNIAAADITVTDNAQGDTTLSWAATVLPPQTQQPNATPNSAAANLITAYVATALSVRVVTKAHDNSAVDAEFTVEVFS
jgi:hypothetical protein